MQRTNNYNYFDSTPSNQRDIQLVNTIDQEQFELYGAAVYYYKVDPLQTNYDPVTRDFISHPNYEEPVQVRGMVKVDDRTAVGMNHESGQSPEREGMVYFNITKIYDDIGRDPQIGDVIMYPGEGKFMIYSLSKTNHKLGRYLRWACSVKLYQDTL